MVREQCPERGVALGHIRSGVTGRCLFCGANPNAPWPSLDKVPTVDPSDAYADMIEVHHREQLACDETGFVFTARRHRDAIGILMVAIEPA